MKRGFVLMAMQQTSAKTSGSPADWYYHFGGPKRKLQFGGHEADSLSGCHSGKMMLTRIMMHVILMQMSHDLSV